MSEPVFLFALAIAGTTLVLVSKVIASAITGRGGPSRSELAEMRAALEDAQASLASQSTQLAELQERLDFAERLLAQGRDRSALGPGGKHG